VACDACQRLCRSHQLDALGQRTSEDAGTGWLLEYLDELLDQIAATRKANGEKGSAELEVDDFEEVEA
jgi:hypothetical protein